MRRKIKLISLSDSTGEAQDEAKRIRFALQSRGQAKKQKTPNPPCKEELGESVTPLNSISELLYDKNVGDATLMAIVNKANAKIKRKRSLFSDIAEAV